MDESYTFYRWEGEDLILAVHIQPRSSESKIVGVHNQRLKIKIMAPPVDGRANAEIYQFLSKLFGVTKSQIVLLNGERGRDKRFRILAPKDLPEEISKFSN
jgi:uncharacterized protein (TIGR00251 family)